MEIWKDISEFNYQVSDMGNVKNKKSGRILKMSIDKNGYKIFTLGLNGKQFNKKLHRVVAEMFIPNIENKPQVNHIDGDKSNNVVYNLEWVTNIENETHAYKIGLKKSIGIDNPNYKHGRRIGINKKIKKIMI